MYNNNLYGFSLSGHTSKILWKLKNVDIRHEVSSNNINSYLNKLIQDQPKYILGMGVYSGVDSNKIRIETIAKNKFRNSAINSDFHMSKQLIINSFIKESERAKLAFALGNSWCNLISWKVMRLIENKELNSQYSFLHIPNKFEINKAIVAVDQLIGHLSY